MPLTIKHDNDNVSDETYELSLSKRELDYIRLLMFLVDTSSLHPVDKNTHAHVKYELDNAETTKKKAN